MAMALRLRKWMVWTAGVVGALALAWSAAPYLVDMQVFKPAMIDAVRQATGRELVIDGPIELSMYPVPGISAREVRFANAVGTKGAQMLDVRRVVVRPSLLALLQGRVEVGTLVLVRPTIVLEADASGKPNWEFTPGAGASQAAGAPAAGLHLAIGRLAIYRGTLNYTDPRTGKTIVAEQVRARASVGSFEGPFTIAGTATVNGVPLTLDVKVGEPGEKGSDLSASLEVASGKLKFVGHRSGFGPDARIAGHLSVATGLVTDFIATLLAAAGQERPIFDAAVIGGFAFEGDIDVSPERVAVADFKMTIADETATGSLALSQKPLLIDGHVALTRVDLEKWLGMKALPGLLRSPEPLPEPPSKPSPPAKAAATPKPPAAPPFPPELGVSVKVDIGELLYRKGTIRDLSVAVDIQNGIITAPHLQARLPGDMLLRASTAASGDPAKRATDGGFSLEGPKLRETLAWLGIDVSGVPADRLLTLNAKGKISSAAEKIQVSDATFALDGVPATGSGTLDLGMPIAATAQVQIDRVDLDGYLPESATDLSAMLPTSAPSAAPAAGNAAPDDPMAPSLGLKAKISSLVYRGQPLKGVEVDLAVRGRLLKLNSFKVADLLGAKLDLRGAVTDFGTAPRIDVTFNATLPDTDRVLDYAALPKFLNGKIGASSASGSVAGTRDALALRNITVTMLGTTARATGTLVPGEKFRFDFPSFDLSTSDASRLVSVASGRSQSGIGAISAAGSFRGNEERATFEGELNALTTPMSGKIDATLGARPDITANLKIPGTLNFDKWLGVAPDVAPGVASATTPLPAGGRIPAGVPHVATGKPIDLSALRAFDASLTLFTSAISVGAVRVTYGDLTATLKNGVFAISKLTGQFYGGAVDFAGTVDASKATLSLGVAGSLQGIYFGEMLRGTAGTNVFGSDSLSVSVDGKLSIMNIQLTGRGDTLEAIRDSLTGRGEVSGYLYPAVYKGSLSLASFATGVGSLFSSEMGFNSAVLQGFVNRQSQVAGELLLGDGLVTLRNHTVQGQNAVAHITSYNSFLAATTDTTIALDTGSRGPADFVMTVKGPISSPTMTTGRGPGR
jgi:hypothetical protein